MSDDSVLSPALLAALQEMLTDDQITAIMQGQRVHLYPGDLAQIFQAGRDSSTEPPAPAANANECPSGDVDDFAEPGYVEKLAVCMREWEPAPEAKEPAVATVAPYQLSPIGMLRYVLPFINSRAIDTALCRDHLLDDCYINTIARRYIERQEARPARLREQASAGAADESQRPAHIALSIPASDKDDIETNLEEHIRVAYERHRERPPLTGMNMFLAWDYFKAGWEECILMYGPPSNRLDGR